MTAFQRTALLAVSALTLATAAYCAPGDDRVAVAATDQILFSVGASGLPPNSIANYINTGVWTDALTSTYNADGAGNKALLVNISAVTAIGTLDYTASNTGALTLNWGGVQARVLVDCALPACDSKSDNVPAANLAAPGAIVLDQTVHFLAAAQSDLRIALDLTAGARAFNFFIEGIGRRPNHSVKFQVKFNGGGVNTSGISGALAAVAKRTMILDAVTLDNATGRR